MFRKYPIFRFATLKQTMTNIKLFSSNCLIAFFQKVIVNTLYLRKNFYSQIEFVIEIIDTFEIKINSRVIELLKVQ